MSRLSSETEYVSFPLDDGTYENLHADRQTAGVYVLDNSPFYAYDVSNGDEVRAELVGGRLLFRSVVKRGGHSTYRVKLSPGNEHDVFLSKFSELETLGCTYEGTGADGQRLYAIDLPPNCDVQKAYQILQDGEDSGFWEFEEAHFFKGYDT